MDRKLYKLPFTKNGMSRYQCPTCNKGVLKIIPDTLQSKETKASRRNQNHPAWDPEWITIIYSCLFECANPDCKEIVSSSGKGGVEEECFYNEMGEPDRNYEKYFKPEYFTPHLKIFHTPKGTPEGVEEEIHKSFSLVFSDPSSSANHIRIALENLLTHLKIKRYTTTNNKRHYLNLHNRIDLLPRKYHQIKDIFLAIKWLGNAGSHSNHEVTIDDVFDSYELIIELLIEIFSNNRKKAKSLAKKINKKKGPK